MKYLARKFLLAVVYVLMVGLNRKYDIGLTDTDIIMSGAAVSSFILGESYNDAKRSVSEVPIISGKHDKAVN